MSASPGAQRPTLSAVMSSTSSIVICSSVSCVPACLACAQTCMPYTWACKDARASYLSARNSSASEVGLVFTPERTRRRSTLRVTAVRLFRITYGKLCTYLSTITQSEHNQIE